MPTSTRPIADIARGLGLGAEEWLPYGRDKAKVLLSTLAARRGQPDDPTLLNRPRGFRVTVNDVRISAGAGFLVAQAGDITTMPGLPRKPNAEGVDVTAQKRPVIVPCAVTSTPSAFGLRGRGRSRVSSEP